MPYDILVVSVGSTTNTFGCPGVEENCLFFKSIEDAKALRKQLSECFERAALPYTSDEVGIHPTRAPIPNSVPCFVCEHVI